MQDIAGCRVVVDDIPKQSDAIEALGKIFESMVIIDRRKKPSHGYRAVHVVVKLRGQPIEIQVRTALQHMWAELSEKLSDVVDPAIKYGGGRDPFRTILANTSSLVERVEAEEQRLTDALRVAPPEEKQPDDMRDAIATARAGLKEVQIQLRELLGSFITTVREEVPGVLPD
jgi:ppGpp synthetase/RelA/SpoT-type nucleotidyltranferase